MVLSLLQEIVMSINDDSPSLFPLPEGSLQSLMNWHSLVCKSLMLVSLYQWEWLAAWQRTLGATPRECMNQWICRFGGGVPLDG